MVNNKTLKGQMNFFQPITNYVERIFFAPKTEGLEIFKKAIDQEGLKIECEVSSHPFL